MYTDKNLTIREAVKLALQNNCYIQQESKSALNIGFYPTNKPSHVEIWNIEKEKMISEKWNPVLNELIATDWRLVKKESDPIKRSLSKLKV